MKLRFVRVSLVASASLIALLGLAACGSEPTATPTTEATATPTQDPSAGMEPWEIEWQQTLEGAREEGVVTVSGRPGAFERQAIVEKWEELYPDIEIEYTGARGTEIVSKVVEERNAGIYAWDAIIAGVNPTVFSFKPINALAPLRDAMITPDLKKDETWILGFEANWGDAEKEIFFGVTGGESTFGYVNRDCVSEEEFNNADDLFKPEFAGQIAWYDPTRPGNASRLTYTLSQAHGEQWLEDLFKNQDIVFAADYRQMTDWLVNCTQPIAIGLSAATLKEFQEQGVGTNVDELVGEDFFGEDFVPGGFSSSTMIGMYNDAPHPNAAKLFVNFYMSQEVQQHYADLNEVNSLRTDTEPRDPPTALDPNKNYFNPSTEEATLGVQDLQDKIREWGVLEN